MMSNQQVTSFVCVIAALFTCGCDMNFVGTFVSSDGYSFSYKGSQVEKKEQGAIDSAVKSIKLDNRFGNIEVKSTEGEAKWEWNVECWASDEALANSFLEQITITSVVSNDTLELKVELPPGSPDFDGRQIESRIACLCRHEC